MDRRDFLYGGIALLALPLGFEGDEDYPLEELFDYAKQIALQGKKGTSLNGLKPHESYFRHGRVDGGEVTVHYTRNESTGMENVFIYTTASIQELSKDRRGHVKSLKGSWDHELSEKEVLDALYTSPNEL